MNCGMYIPLCDHFWAMHKYDVMVTISYSHCKSLRLRFVQYDVVTVATLSHTGVVLHATI